MSDNLFKYNSILSSLRDKDFEDLIIFLEEHSYDSEYTLKFNSIKIQSIIESRFYDYVHENIVEKRRVGVDSYEVYTSISNANQFAERAFKLGIYLYKEI
ncbi:hypothetical protein MTsPCn9_06340 [Croceitalea sp. MTPC9]|uniref:hypothetical protein n=1 Tax=unclassified Croceitalea TaxID=2632280 RepID=UPI002B3E1313|nr:hypothetical protein MTsPCn6_02370 [Croceitalea sp. MTPC6]GMN15698.1 hypothetical protein MTsPCn9_06340 [Croceitalea sp. MTPC9]